MRLIITTLAAALTMGCLTLDPTKSDVESRTVKRCIWSAPYKLPEPDTMRACLDQTREAQEWLESRPQTYTFHRCLLETRDRFGVDAYNTRRCIQNAN